MTDKAPGLLVVLAGPSGVGKGTIVRRLLEGIDGAVVSTSVTTRRPRPGEEDGVDYHFVEQDRFDEMVAQGELLEYAKYASNSYGTPRGQVEADVEAGRVVILEIEVQGAMQVRQAAPDAQLLFVMPPDVDELERRLRERATEDEATVSRRLAAARDEMDQRMAFDHVVVNDELDRATEEIVDLIERARQRRTALSSVGRGRALIGLLARACAAAAATLRTI